jgi:2Fe-2S ferredoxin
MHNAKVNPTSCARRKAQKENPHYICGMDMIKVTVLDREGKEHLLDAPTDMGLSVMELCKSYELPVEGTCGGMALCASCHVYVLSDHALSEPTDDELAMLDAAFFVKPNSRLGCQIKLREEFDGLQLQLAPVAL